jgi:hypothetical protein
MLAATVKLEPLLREPIIPNLLVLGIVEIGSAGQPYFREQKKLLREN